MALPLIGILASIGAAKIGGDASKAAAKETGAATRYAADITRQNFLDSTALLKPSIEAGDTARKYQLGALGLPGEIGYEDAVNTFRTSPGYDFAVGQGKDAVQGSAAAGGRLFSGKTLKSLNTFGQGMADQEFGSWFDRLGGLSGSGDQATGRQVASGAGTAGTLADLAVRGGDTRASSYITGANALTGGIQNIADLVSYYRDPRRASPVSYGGAAALRR